jgi:hypothetical protein
VALGRLATTYVSPVLSILALVGLVRWISAGIRDAFAKKLSTVALAGAVFLTVLIVVLMWIPLDWDRYYLPMVVASAPFSSLGGCLIVETIYRRSMRYSS